MKKIILLSGTYPSVKGNIFLDIEERYFPHDVRIDVLPSEYNPELSERHPVPENVTVGDLLWRKTPALTHILYCAGALFSRLFRQDIGRMRSEKRLTVKYFCKALSFAARGNLMFRQLERQYRDELRSDPESLVFYSFWMLIPAYAAARLREKYGCHAAARANGGDLFEERVDYGRLPMRHYTLENLDFVSACSADGRDYLRRKYDRGEIRLAYLGTEDFGVRNTAQGRKPFVVVSCGNVIPLKRVHMIAEALMLIEDREIEWYHFGNGELGDVDDMPKVEERAARLPENVHAHLPGRLPHDELVKWYQEHDAHLFVSVSTTETTPVSIMEALSFGIPALVTLAGGSGEAVREGHGMCIPVDTCPEQIAEGIRRFIDMPEDEYAGYRRNARAFWEENFSAELNYARFYNWLGEL